MKLNYGEKKTLLENLTNRMIKIEQAIGSIKFYEKGSGAKRLRKDGTSFGSVKAVEGGEKDFLNKPLVSFDDDDLLGAHKDEVVELIKKHGHKNSVAVHICTIKLILQQIAKEFLHDIYTQYNDFYIYIHSNSILDVYNTFEYKRNIILSHLDFMKTYSQQVQKIMQLKENINSYKMSGKRLCPNGAAPGEVAQN
ncbi:hypothetical protein PVBG_00420 [Plasmodium vivax Brazil I]|uniref:Uncharacterized protein n=1 Tax=Plasmodium vivax (strain Brazil I) TaxID=1033975 RepID=A0A0J9SNC9_PLAV1|nr:hypothetical protein PVBG_00420 [Plasmodium vivax Brazil I]